MVNLPEAHPYNYQGYSILPQEGAFCQVAESGEVKTGDSVTVTEDHREN